MDYVEMSPTLHAANMADLAVEQGSQPWAARKAGFVCPPVLRAMCVCACTRSTQRASHKAED